jgi:deoxyribodipyrimidine photo-lyase
MSGLPIFGDRDFVLYWMIAARRVRYNYALERAIVWARELQKPLVVLEALRVDYPWASDRLHRFVLDGMSDNQRGFLDAGIAYYPYVEPRHGAGRGLLAALARHASVVVTDHFPCFFLPRMVAAASKKIEAKLEAVDSNGLLPLSAADRDFTTAASFRRHVQAELPKHLPSFPRANPLAGALLRRPYRLPREIVERWPRADPDLLRGDAAALAELPVDHAVPVVGTRGGSQEAAKVLRRFLRRHLASYPTLHNDPSADATSRLSPYLHFGHIGSHEVFAALARKERWSPRNLSREVTGHRSGYFGMSEAAEAFLEQLIVWRELGYTMCDRQPETYDRYESLPTWARATLAAHARDHRPHRYDRAAFEAAATHDPAWNAVQRQLLCEGFQHNYMRMLWGKKILEWSSTPREALQTMIAIMNRWSLDGRDPNSYTGYLWTLGRYDRPWPGRPIYGNVRSMSSERTAAKVDLSKYLKKYGSH